MRRRWIEADAWILDDRYAVTNAIIKESVQLAGGWIEALLKGQYCRKKTKPACGQSLDRCSVVIRIIEGEVANSEQRLVIEV